ncbi:MAG: hypothetical protein IJ147_00685 [Lachnospiraceae bacterium]|nr:hypothetical protein [Lachnospiraceae bacterium]
MKKVAIILDAQRKEDPMTKQMVRLLEEAFAVRQYQTTLVCLEADGSNRQMNALMEEQKPEILCSLDMAGFEASTLTETFYYNICTAKQMHIVLHEKKWRDYQSGEFALNLYLFLPGETVKWQRAFPDIPNLYGYEAFDGSEKDRQTLDHMIQIFLQDITC